MFQQRLPGMAAAALIVIAAAAPQAVFGAQAFECPEPAKLGPAAKVKLASDLVPDARALSDLGALTKTVALFREHGFSNADTVNYINALYCPVIRADQSLDAAAKTAKARDFSAVLSDAVY